MITQSGKPLEILNLAKIVQNVNGSSSGLCVLCLVSINERRASSFHCKVNVFVEIFFLSN